MANQQDKQLNDYLTGKDGLSALYGNGDSEQPPAALDKAILDAAREALPGNPKGTGPFGGSWFVPASLAAVLVLAVGIVLTMESEVGPDMYEADDYRPVELKPAPAREIHDKKKTETRQQPTASKRDVIQTSPTVKPGSSEAKGARERRFDQPDAGIEKSVAEPQTEVAPAPATVVEQPVAPPAAEPEAPEMAPMEMRSAPAPIDGESLQDSLPSKMQKSKAGEIAAPQTAERWLQSIRDLMAQDRVDEARQQLADFRRVYPEYPLGKEFELLMQ